MSTDLLFEYFATLATAPDGIGRLRELILQLAVQGKLGTHNAGDEPASVLLKRIEKERMASEGKNKKEKTLAPVKNNDVGFQIPDTWVLTRLGNIAQYNAETKISANEISDDAWVLDLEDIEKDTSRILQKVRFKDRRSLSTKSRFRKGDILYGKLRPYLNKVVVADEDGYCTTEIVPIRPYGKIFSTFLMYALKTPDFLSYVNSKTYGIKMPRLGTVDALNTIIPLPPLAEQHRIVAKVDRLIALCDELEARQQRERAGCLRLGTASLAGFQNATHKEEFERQWVQVCDAFDLILDCPENVALLRQTILNMAVKGRLVRQDPGDEPAKKLVERIRIEKERLVKQGKVKREKILDLTNGIETPFTIPQGWTLISLHELGIFTGGFTPSTAKGDYWNGNIPWVSPKDVKSKYILDSELKITQSALDNNRLHMIPSESIIIVARSGILKRTLPVAITKIDCTVNQDIKVIIPYLPIIAEYLHLLLKGYEQFILKKLVKGGMTVQSLKYDEFEFQPFPLPPLAEQHRIVAKVDALMALCDALESRLKERAGVQARLAGAVVMEVAGDV